MIAFDNCALFIGVADYSAFDASIGQPKGTSDLPGARADALAFYRICTGLGIPAENMRILTSPRLDAEKDGVPAECLGDATHASILSGIEWLASRLGSSSRPPGLFTYAGHGDCPEGQGLVICPSDTTGPNLTGAIPYSQIQSIFEAEKAMANLTSILDTCHSGAATAGMGRSAGSLTRRNLKALLAGGVPSLGDRVIAACEPAQFAWRGRFSGVGRGALSWAVASTLEQWSPRAQGQSVELDLSYGELLERTKSLLSALSFEQIPVLRGRPGTARTPFFHSGRGPGKEGTSEDPTALRLSEQVMPDVKVLLTGSWWSGNWPVVSVGETPPSTTYNLQTEYWALDSNFSSHNPTSGNTITFSLGSYGTAGQAVPLTNPRVSLWTQLSATPEGSFYVGTAPATGNSIALAFNNLTSPGTGKAWTGNLTWYAVAPTNSSGPPGSIIAPTSTSPQTLTYGALPSPGTGNSWFTMTLPALIWGSAPHQVTQSTSVGAAMATMNGTLSLVSAKDGGGDIQQFTSTDGARWSGPVETGVSSSSYAPGLAALGSTLYMVYATGSGTHFHQRTFDGTRWSGITDTNISAMSSPALANANGVLCLAYQVRGNATEIGTRVWNDNAWTNEVLAGTSAANGAPSLAWFNGKLYLAFPDTSNNIQIYKATSVGTEGITWPTSGNPVATLTPPGGSLWMSASLSVWQGQLVLTYQDATGNVWACFSSDGTTWSGYQNLTMQIRAVSTTSPPAAGSIGSAPQTLVLAFNGQTTSATGLQSIATSSNAFSG